MEIGAITGYVDVAQVVLYVFWAFFFGLIYYLHTENKREGYPLETDHLDPARREKVQGLTHLPAPKTFKLADGSTVQAPDPARADRRTLAAVATAKTPGSTITPSGNPMLSEIGPGSYAERADRPDLTFHGTPKIVPLRVATDFHVEARDPDPRGMPVVGADRKVAGTVKEIWVDRGEHIVRFLEMTVGGPEGRSALLPINLAVIDRRAGKVRVESLLSGQFAQIPAIANPDQVTRLEEEKIYGYFGAGTLYAMRRRTEPMV